MLLESSSSFFIPSAHDRAWTVAPVWAQSGLETRQTLLIHEVFLPELVGVNPRFLAGIFILRQLRKLFFNNKMEEKWQAGHLQEMSLVSGITWCFCAGLSWGDEGAPPVFLCHGKLDVCSGFRPLVRMLPEGFHYVTVDLPGNGKYVLHCAIRWYTRIQQLVLPVI